MQLLRQYIYNSGSETNIKNPAGTKLGNQITGDYGPILLPRHFDTLTVESQLLNSSIVNSTIIFCVDSGFSSFFSRMDIASCLVKTLSFTCIFFFSFFCQN